MRRVHDLLLAALCAAGPVGPLAAAEGAAHALPRHELIYSSHADAARTDYDLWRMCADGTQMASLVVEPGHQLQVSISPDGTEFVYAGQSGEDWELWRRPFGRGEAVNLTRNPAKDSEPAWAPDGGRIAFFSDRDGEKPELYVLGLEDGSLRRLTENAFHDSGASWSPDGKTLVFTRFFPAGEGGDHDGAGEVVSLDLATGKEKQLTRLGGYNGGLSYSPDGRRIAFHRAADGRAEIWIMRSDGTGARALTDTHRDEYSPEWSPDGRWLAYSAGTQNDSRGTFDLWLMRADGTGAHVLNAAANTQAWHAWRPGDHHCR